MTDSRSAARPPADPLLVMLADYVCLESSFDQKALAAARLCLLDALACAFLALNDQACRQRLGPIVPGAQLPGGARVPGTQYELEPVRACFNSGCLIRWLDYNDTWLAAEWGHPSDNLAAILACGDYLDRSALRSLTMRDVLNAQIKAYEIQGVLALENAFNQQGLDHVLLVRIASAAVCTQLLGGDHQLVINALSNALADGAALRVYRHAPNTGWRKSWAAGDAAARGVQHALMAMKGEMGYASVLSAEHWGFESVLMDKKALRLSQPLADYVIQNILFKASFPAEFHAQTAVECGIALHEVLQNQLDDIAHIRLYTQAAGQRIIDKTGALNNPADRDHCLQYAVAIALLKGHLEAHDYSDAAAGDPRIDELRDKMTVLEDPQFSQDYLHPQKRAIANRVAITLQDGREFVREQAYPLGHPRRREEAKPLLLDKFKAAATGVLSAQTAETLKQLMLDPLQLDDMPVADFMALLIPQERTK